MVLLFFSHSQIDPKVAFPRRAQPKVRINWWLTLFKEKWLCLMSLAYIILCAHTADTKRQCLYICYYREIPSLAPLFSPCLCCFTKAIKVGHIRLKGNVQHDWGYVFCFLYYLTVFIATSFSVLSCLYIHFIPHYSCF